MIWVYCLCQHEWEEEEEKGEKRSLASEHTHTTRKFSLISLQRFHACDSVYAVCCARNKYRKGNEEDQEWGRKEMLILLCLWLRTYTCMGENERERKNANMHEYYGDCDTIATSFARSRMYTHAMRWRCVHTHTLARMKKKEREMWWLWDYCIVV